MTTLGHTRRFDIIADRRMPIISPTIPWFTQSTGGRFMDLPTYYLDAIASAVTRTHPRSLMRRSLVYALICGRFRPSSHPTLRRLTLEQVEELKTAWGRGDFVRRRREFGEALDRSLLATRRVV